jgi:putative ABC transport system permease protein
MSTTIFDLQGPPGAGVLEPAPPRRRLPRPLAAAADLWRRGLLENVRFAMRGVIADKLRSALTVLGIVIGVATVIAMVSLIEGFNNQVRESFELFGATLVQFQKFDPRFGHGGPPPEQRNRKNLTYEDALALKRLCPSMKAVSPERYWFGGPDSQPVPSVVYGSTEGTPDTLVGTTEDYPEANNRAVGEGRFLSVSDVRRRADVVVIGFGLAETLFPHSDPLGKRVTIAGRRYEVVGVMEELGNSFGESTDLHVYLPITTYDLRFPWIKRTVGVNIATVPKRPEWVDRIYEEGVAVLRVRRGLRFDQENDFGVRTTDALVGNFRRVTGGIALTMLFISSIALVVGGVGVMNIMLVSVTERTREVGVRKALGATNRDVLAQFLTEAMTLAAVGGVVGVAVGIGIATVVREVSPLATATPLWSILVGLGVSISIGLFFGAYPAWQAAKLDPVEALRYE